MATLKSRLQALEGTVKPGQEPGCMVLEYESDEHFARAIADARAAGFRGCVIALPKRTPIGAES